MTMPFAAPGWMPGWLLLALAIPALLWILAFLMVPFSVFGVKARLETVENELAELNEQFRVMQIRAAGRMTAEAPMRPADAPVRNAESYDDLPSFAQLKRSRPEPLPVQEDPPALKRPPIPTPQPRSGFGNREPMSARERHQTTPRHRRTEPKLD